MGVLTYGDVGGVCDFGFLEADNGRGEGRGKELEIWKIGP